MEQVSAALVVLLTVIWLRTRGESAAALARYGLSLDDVLVRREYHRLLTASFVHLDFLHLACNLGALVTQSEHERDIGSAAFALRTAFFLAASTAAELALLFAHAAHSGDRNLRRVRSAGYSGVLFAWKAVELLQHYAHSYVPYELFGVEVAQTPPVVALVIDLLLRHFLLRDSAEESLHGHLGGIAAGAALWAVEPHAMRSVQLVRHFWSHGVQISVNQLVSIAVLFGLVANGRNGERR